MARPRHRIKRLHVTIQDESKAVVCAWHNQLLEISLEREAVILLPFGSGEVGRYSGVGNADSEGYVRQE